MMKKKIISGMLWTILALGQARDTRENLRSLFDSLLKNETEKTKSLRNDLGQEVMKEQKAFATMKDDLRLRQKKNAHRQQHDAVVEREAFTASTMDLWQHIYARHTPPEVITNPPSIKSTARLSFVEECMAEMGLEGKAIDELKPVELGELKGIINSKHTILHGLVKYLMEDVSLCVLRNKIDHLEARYGVGDLEVDELAKLLKQDSLNLKKLVGDMRQYINTRPESEPNTVEMQKLVTKVKLQVEEDLEKLSQTPVDPKMSELVSVKAGKHALRCLLIFHQYPMDTQVKEMKKVVDLKFDGSIDDACREQGFLVVLLSTLGIHVLPPSFDIRNIAAADMKHGLYHFGIRGEKSMAIVDLLHCGEVDESYMKSLSTISSS